MQPVVSCEQTCNNFVCKPVITRVFTVSIYFTFNNLMYFFVAVSSLQPPIKSYAPIESVVRKPTTIAQVPSASHVTTGINSVQLMTSHNPTASVAVVNMGKYFCRCEILYEFSKETCELDKYNIVKLFTPAMILYIKTFQLINRCLLGSLCVYTIK